MTQMGFLANLSLPSTPMYFDLDRISQSWSSLTLIKHCCHCIYHPLKNHNSDRYDVEPAASSPKPDQIFHPKESHKEDFLMITNAVSNN